MPDVDPTTNAYINGTTTEAQAGRRFASLNPATGRPLAHVAACDTADVNRAVMSARSAFDDGRWSRLSPADRKQVILRLAGLMEAHAEELATLDALDAGKPVTDCREIDVPEAIKTFCWYAEAGDKLFDAVAPTGDDALGLIVREPVGVVGAVLPWNFPLLMAAWKCAPALVAGNSVVLKPAELTPLSALRLAELATEAGLPDGVLNVVPGFGETAGQALGRHPGVDVISFTGSTEVGRMFLNYSAESNLKRVVLECGGKSPQIVFADAPDLSRVADDVLAAAFWNMGENCSAGSRLLVHASVKEDLLSEVASRLNGWSVGDPLDPATKLGPLIEEAHLQKVMSYIEAGRDAGAKVLTGGVRLLEETGGWFVAPTILDDVSNDMRVAREEIFGPVLSVISFETEAEAVEIANDTSYGLAASVWTTNLDTAIRVSRAVRAGTVTVNNYSEGDVTTPFGGYKESGFGGRDNGLEAFQQYMESKTIWIATS